MKICIKDLQAQTLLGIYPHERQALRTVILNLTIEYDGNTAAHSDHISDALDYDAIEKTIIQSLPNQKFQLLEALAAHVVQLVLAIDKVREVTVEIDKPGALAHAASVSVSCSGRN